MCHSETAGKEPLCSTLWFHMQSYGLEKWQQSFAVCLSDAKSLARKSANSSFKTSKSNFTHCLSLETPIWQIQTNTFETWHTQLLQSRRIYNAALTYVTHTPVDGGGAWLLSGFWREAWQKVWQLLVPFTSMNSSLRSLITFQLEVFTCHAFTSCLFCL